MDDCCETKPTQKFKKKEGCPNCKQPQNITTYQTVLHQLLTPYAQKINEDLGYYFCRNQDCNVVYFDTENNSFGEKDVRFKIGQKSKTLNRQICYCFDVTHDQVMSEIEENGFSEIKEFVKSQTKVKNCACEIRNPSGRCCLVDFPKG